MIYIRYIVVIIFSFLSACSIVKDVEIIDVGKIDSILVVDDSLIINLSSSVYNPNFFDLKLQGLEFDLLNNTSLFGKGHVDQDIFIKKHDTVQISSRINISISMLPDDIFYQDTQDIKVVGFANVKAPVNKFYFSLDQTINISDYIDLLVSDLFKDEDFELKKISVNTISLSDVTLDGVFQISNKHNLRYSIEKVNIDFYATSQYEKKIGSSQINSNFLIEPNSLNMFDFSVKLKSKDAGSFLLSKLFRKNNKIYMNLNVIVKYQSLTFPFHMNQELTY